MTTRTLAVLLPPATAAVRPRFPASPRREQFAQTFPDLKAHDEPGFAAGDVRFEASSAEVKSEGLALHVYQAAAAVGEKKLVLSLACETEGRAGVRAQTPSVRNSLSSRRFSPERRPLTPLLRLRYI